MTVALPYRLTPAHAKLLAHPGLGEVEFQKWVMHVVDRNGACGFHVRDSEGVVQGVHKLFAHGHDDASGWPDWVFVREDPPLFLVRELKSNTGILSRHQKHWLRVLKAAGVDADVWRPRNVTRILAELS